MNLIFIRTGNRLKVRQKIAHFVMRDLAVLKRSIVRQVRYCVGFCLLVLLSSSLPAQTADRPTVALSDYFPQPEDRGG